MSTILIDSDSDFPVRSYPLSSSGDSDFEVNLPSYDEVTCNNTSVVHHYGPYNHSEGTGNPSPASVLPMSSQGYQPVPNITLNHVTSTNSLIDDDDDDDDDEYWAWKEDRSYRPTNQASCHRTTQQRRQHRSIASVRAGNTAYQHPQYQKWLAQQRTRIVRELDWCWTTAEHPCFDCDFIIGTHQRKGVGIGILVNCLYFCENCYILRHQREGIPINFREDISHVDREDYLAQELIYQQKIKEIQVGRIGPTNRVYSNPYSTNGLTCGWNSFTQSSEDEHLSDENTELTKALNLVNQVSVD